MMHVCSRTNFYSALRLSAILAGLSATIAAQSLTHGRPQHFPKPFTTPVKAFSPQKAAPPPGWHPRAPHGFMVTQYARGLRNPRWLAIAPNGALFVAETGPGRVLVLTHAHAQPSVFAHGLRRPFGIAFHGHYVYIADTNEVLRYPFNAQTNRATGPAQKILALPGGGMHFTRSIAFSRQGRHMFVSVGSDCNVCIEKDPRRAAVLEATPEGKDMHIYASGLRNSVGLGVNPVSGQVWSAVNERDMLGNAIPPDYFTHLKPGGFYGWPYSYIGQHLDPRIHHKNPGLVSRAIIPDVLLGPHFAPLQFAFYTGRQFPAQYHDGAFIAEHGSWNSSVLHGYYVAFVAFKGGQPESAPRPFLRGFVKSRTQGTVYGRPVGVAVGRHGSLYISDDTGNVIWKVKKR